MKRVFKYYMKHEVNGKMWLTTSTQSYVKDIIGDFLGRCKFKRQHGCKAGTNMIAYVYEDTDPKSETAAMKFIEKHFPGVVCKHEYIIKE